MSPALFLFELLKMGKLTRGPLVLYHLPKFCVEVLRLTYLSIEARNQ